ncbi:MAG: glutaredoxin 3 [Planctomycetes bacterium]|nr:glutaredoxin 3 [Planctomycetota bacterium]
MAKIEIYSKDTCPYCKNAKALLASLGAKYEEINLTEQPERVQEMLDRSGGRTTVPEIFINDKLIGGFDDLMAVHRKGDLKVMLAE